MFITNLENLNKIKSFNSCILTLIANESIVVFLKAKKVLFSISTNRFMKSNANYCSNI